MDRVDVAIVGAGPTGLALAQELRLAGVSCRVLERRTNQPNLTRAFALHARTLELLDGRGLADQIMPRGIAVPEVAPAPGAVLRLSIIDSKYPLVLIVPQSLTEHALEARAKELGAEISYGAEVVGLRQDAETVTLDLAGGDSVQASYVVGTDGAHSVVRTLAGIDFAGDQYETHIMLADVRLDRAPEETLFGRNNSFGLVLFVPFGDGWFRAIAWDRTREGVPLAEPITLDELRATFQRIAGDDFGMNEPRWQTRFLSELRQARHYRAGRVFLAGDAAHVHSPVGGQGMNTGIQDAMNLGWKLASALGGRGPADLLDSYERERHPVGAAVLKITDRLFKLVLASSKLGAAVRQRVIRLAIHIGPVRRLVANQLTGVGIRYARGAHRLVGQRYPHTGPETQPVYDALRSAQFVVVQRGGTEVEGADRVVHLPAAAGQPSTVLIRPDGYVAWASDQPDPGALAAALTEWCGTRPHVAT